MQHRPSRLNNHIEHSNKCAINEHLYARLTTVGGVVCAQFECLINLQAIELCVFFLFVSGQAGRGAVDDDGACKASHRCLVEWSVFRFRRDQTHWIWFETGDRRWDWKFAVNWKCSILISMYWVQSMAVSGADFKHEKKKTTESKPNDLKIE